jgi:hypothetical protein
LVVGDIDFASVGVFVGDGTLNLILCTCTFDDFDAPGSFATFDIVVKWVNVFIDFGLKRSFSTLCSFVFFFFFFFFLPAAPFVINAKIRIAMTK